MSEEARNIAAKKLVNVYNDYDSGRYGNERAKEMKDITVEALGNTGSEVAAKKLVDVYDDYDSGRYSNERAREMKNNVVKSLGKIGKSQD